MSSTQTVTFYMEPDLCRSAQAGKHNFISKIERVLGAAKLNIAYDVLPKDGAPAGKGWSLSHIKSPPDARGLCFRRAYHYPFWQIEQSAERWSWDVAQADFNPDPEAAKEAARFYRFWKKRLFGDAPNNTKRNGFVYAPLQGKLADHRPFQICSPIEMLEHCLEQSDMPVIATLHPDEKYSRAEITQLGRLEAAHHRLTVQRGGMEELLQGCDYIVTQNSSVAFNGYFFGKPALLFRRTDFHHIALRADLENIADGFAAVRRSEPDYAAYVHWFWQQNSINAGRQEAEAQIAARLRRFGWPV